MIVRVTGETAHLEQIVQDMKAAGSGATESRAYRAIVAELERRENETAPVVSPVVGATGDEGQNQSNTHEGASSL